MERNTTISKGTNRKINFLDKMDTLTYPTSCLDRANTFCSFGFSDESVQTSRARVESEVRNACSIFLKISTQALTDLTTEDTFCRILKFTGQQLVDPISEIEKAGSMATLISIARSWISEEIAHDLAELDDMPLEEGELPLSLDSVKHFLRYGFSKGLREPILTATQDGFIQADWENDDEGGIVSIRFLANSKAWVLSRTNEMKGSVEIPLTALLANVTPINFPSWANE